MADEPPVTPEKKSHTGLIVAIVLIVIVVLLALFFGLYFGLRNNEPDTPDEITPDPDIVEPGPVEDPDGGDDGGDGSGTQYLELTLNKYEYELLESSEEELVVTTNTPASITFSSTNDSIAYGAEHDGSYYIYSGAMTGEASITVTATAEGWVAATKTVNVTVVEYLSSEPVVTSIEFDNASYKMEVGDDPIDFASHVTIKGTNNPTQEFTLTSSDVNNEYITISNNVVTAIKETPEDSPITLTATREDHNHTWTATAELTIQAQTPRVTSISFYNDPYEVELNSTLDLSNAVTVTGNEALTDTSFTITCDDGSSSNEYISITDNVVTGLVPTTNEGITIKATANADTSQTATTTVTVSDPTNYVSSVSLSTTNSIDTLYFSNSELDESHPESTELIVNLTGTKDGDPYDTGYTVKVEDESVVKYDETTHTLTAVASDSHEDRSTTITATSEGINGYNGTVVTSDPLTITVKYVETLVSSIELTKNEFDLRETETFMVGPSDVSGVDIGATLGPSEADDKSFTVTPDEKLTVTGPDGNGVYTIAAVSDHASEVGTLTIVPTYPKDENVTAEIKVNILAEDYDYNYVTGLTLTGDAISLQNGNSDNNSFTLGPSGSDIVVDYTLTDPSEEAGNKALNVTCESDYIQINADDDTNESFTITALDGANSDSKEPNEYTLSITALGSKNQTVVTSYTFTVARPDEYADDWTVTGGDDLKLDIPAVDAPAITTSSLDLESYLTVSVQNQYGETMDSGVSNEYTITATTGEITYNGNTISSIAGTSSGSATVTITSSDVITEENKSKTLTITLNAVTYPVETITINGNSEDTETVEWGGSVSVNIEVSPSYATNPSYSVTSNLTNSNVGTYFTYEDGTFTHNKTHSGSETFTVTALDGSGVSASITITAEPEILEPQSAAFDGLGGTYEIDTVINNLDNYLKVNFDEEGHDEGDFVDDTCTVEYTSSDTSVVSIDNDAKTATCVGTGTSTITATITPDHDTEHPITIDTTNGAEINVIWTASTLTMSPTTLDLTEGDSDTLSVTFGPEGYTTTPTVTWEVTEGSDYVSISPETGDSTTVTALENGAGTAVITASADGCPSVSCTVTVSAKVTSSRFSTDSWETINEICTNGEASTYYNIGDTKTITINSESHDIRIIGFDHDDLTTNSSGYNNNSGKAAITVEMVDCLSTTHAINSSNTNIGGWYSCEMRSYLNSDSGCVLSTLDEDLQAVIKQVDKKSTAGSQSTSLGTTASDSLFLLAYVEVGGSGTGYNNEGTLYAYYSEHNTADDRIKYLNGSANSWWLRSPSTGNSTNFLYVGASGGIVYAGHASNAYGVSFGFCI